MSGRITEYVGHDGVHSSTLDHWRMGRPMPGAVIRVGAASDAEMARSRSNSAGSVWTRTPK